MENRRSFLSVLLALAFEVSANRKLPFEDHEEIEAELSSYDPVLVGVFYRGYRDLTSDDLDDAAQEFEKVVEGAPEFDVGLGYFGRLRFESGEREEGLTSIERAYAINPRPGTAFWLALTRWRCHLEGDEFLDSGEVDEIVPLALQAVEAYPQSRNTVELAFGVLCDLGNPRRFGRADH